MSLQEFYALLQYWVKLKYIQAFHLYVVNFRLYVQSSVTLNRKLRKWIMTWLAVCFVLVNAVYGVWRNSWCLSIATHISFVLLEALTFYPLVSIETFEKLLFVTEHLYSLNVFNWWKQESPVFLISGKEAFTLIVNNAVRTFVLNSMVDFLLFLGKMVIVVGAGTMSYFVFYGYFPELFGETGWKIPQLNYSFTPIICIVVGTYFITTSFFNVYSMAVDTLFLCFLQDLKQNDGSRQHPYFMSKGIDNI